MPKRKDMAGQRYGRLTALLDIGQVPSGDRKWQFVCDCGSKFEASGYAARSGKIIDCPACAAKRSSAASVTHGMTNTNEYKIWTGILTRCLNKNSKSYLDYGGRGISVCEKWANSFESFYADMGPRPSKSHSIDRKDNSGNYEPDNCRWATIAEQASNKRNTVLAFVGDESLRVPEIAAKAGTTPSAIHLRIKKGAKNLSAASKRSGCVTHNGITDTYKGWSKRTGIKPSTIAMRLKAYGWPIAKALTKGELF